LRDNPITFPSITDVEPAFVRLFEEPAIGCYHRVTVATLYASFEEAQERWSHRFSKGMPAETGPILAEKNTIFTDPRLGKMAFQSICAAWEKHLELLSGTGKLAGSGQFEVYFDGRAPSSPDAFALNYSPPMPDVHAAVAH
jgi:hypothetical protein